MKDLDKESQENLKEAFRIIGYIVMVSTLSFIILYSVMEFIPSWSWGLIVILCGFITRIVDKKLSLKQMYRINLLLISLNIVIIIAN
ncbi:hypothetical protein N0O92_12965 [Alkalihalobacillus sp. MEB130]|uniref:hypothetical protein n=1 Tax=Alkalihalobacillus sp. MEB130 TaxID=2976704 RepID=UPI0028E06236|nr:hypothetical protein [Alkalihalobacillus sp. MEB130]MDT8861147.1 hypothetical protein [Alkalihalobacillus sp. MEB130]